MTTPTVRRELTAIRRLDFSRPIRVALDDEIITEETSVLDYGCGHGDDVDRLMNQGFRVVGWDPAHSPDTPLRPADVVNLGYVVNVIEDSDERAQVLQHAWSLAEQVLVVSARLVFEASEGDFTPHADGVLTTRETFQKFYQQHELREWIDDTLGVKSVAAAPGIFYVFRRPDLKQGFLARRQHREFSGPQLRRSDVLFEENRTVLEPLMDFIRDWGRLPDEREFDLVPEIRDRLGSLRRAFWVIRKVTGKDEWREIRAARADDLLVFLALAKFGGRPRLSDLPHSLQRDVRAFFSTYKKACARADDLLFSAGNAEALEDAFEEVSVGKKTRKGLYCHVSALAHLPPVLRVYVGCAQAYIGRVDEANVLKLHRLKPAITYMTYREFDSDPHPALEKSLRVELHTFDVKIRDFTDWDDPPILHRKDAHVPPDYPLRETFAELSRQEEEAGLLEDVHEFNTRKTWGTRLASQGLRLDGHRLVRNGGEQQE